MDLENIFSDSGSLQDLKPDNKDIAILEKFYGEDYFYDLRNHINLRISDYIYDGAISSITSDEFRELTDFLYDVGVGTLKKILDSSLNSSKYDSYRSLFKEKDLVNLPDPEYHVCLFEEESEELEKILKPDTLNIILKLTFDN